MIIERSAIPAAPPSGSPATFAKWASDRYTPKVQRLLSRSWSLVRDRHGAELRRAIEDAVRSGRLWELDAVLARITPAIREALAPVSAALTEAAKSGYSYGARQSAAEVARRIRGNPFDASRIAPAVAHATNPAAAAHAGVMGLAFTLRDPWAEEWASRNAARLVVEIGDALRAGLRALVETAIRDGFPPAQAARMAVDLGLGLNSRLAIAVERYAVKLRDELGLSADVADRLVSRYAARLLRYRANMIARTEILWSANAGQQAAWEQAQDAGFLPVGGGYVTKRKWIVTPDERLCEDVCLPMTGVLVDLRQPFLVQIKGATVAVMIPQEVHPHCRCTFGLVIVKEAGPVPVTPATDQAA